MLIIKMSAMGYKILFVQTFDSIAPAVFIYPHVADGCSKCLAILRNALADGWQRNVDFEKSMGLKQVIWQISTGLLKVSLRHGRPPNLQLAAVQPRERISFLKIRSSDNVQFDSFDHWRIYSLVRKRCKLRTQKKTFFLQ